MINAVHKALLAILIAAESAGVTATWGQDAKMNADVVRKAIIAVPMWHIDRTHLLESIHCAGPTPIR
jgi:hypothetical protein